MDSLEWSVSTDQRPRAQALCAAVHDARFGTPAAARDGETRRNTAL